MRSWFLSLLLFSFASLAQADSCKDSFISCVQGTGNPASCQSTYQQCTSEPRVVTSLAPANNDSLSLKPHLIEVAGRSSIELWATNTSKNPVALSSVEFSVSCADKSVERAIFSLGGMLSPTQEPQKIGVAQAICIQAGGTAALMGTGESPTKGAHSKPLL